MAPVGMESLTGVFVAAANLTCSPCQCFTSNCCSQKPNDGDLYLWCNKCYSARETWRQWLWLCRQN